VKAMEGELEYATKTVEESYVKIKQHEDQKRKSYYKVYSLACL
jgi:hypothetical protein